MMTQSCLVLPFVKKYPHVDPNKLYAYADYVLRDFQGTSGGWTAGKLALDLMSSMGNKNFEEFTDTLAAAFDNRRPKV